MDSITKLDLYASAILSGMLASGKHTLSSNSEVYAVLGWAFDAAKIAVEKSNYEQQDISQEKPTPSFGHRTI